MVERSRARHGTELLREEFSLWKVLAHEGHLIKAWGLGGQEMAAMLVSTVSFCPRSGRQTKSMTKSRFLPFGFQMAWEVRTFSIMQKS